MQLNELAQSLNLDTYEIVRTSRKGNMVYEAMRSSYYHDTPSTICEETWSYSIVVHPKTGEVIAYTLEDCDIIMC